MFNKHSIVEGAKNLTRSFWLSITAVTVLVVSLSSVAIIMILRTSTSFTLKQLDNNVDIAASVKKTVSEDALKSIGDELNQMPDIKSWRYVNSEEAKKELAENNNFLPGFGDTIFKSDKTDLSYFIIKPTSIETYSNVRSFLTGDRYKDVWEVEDKQDFITNLKSIYYWTNWIGIAVVIIFSLIAVLVMANILRMAIYSYKGEIEIMRLVGATNSYIQGPFIMQGTYFTVLASVVMLVIFIPLGNLTSNYFSANISSNTTGLLSEIYLSLGAVAIVSVLVGMATSFFATQKYLQQ